MSIHGEGHHGLIDGMRERVIAMGGQGVAKGAAAPLTPHDERLAALPGVLASVSPHDFIPSAEEVAALPFHLRVALVCSSNNNRSMAAHCALVAAGVPHSLVGSFGAGGMCVPYKDHQYEFGTPYDKMIEDIVQEPQNRFTEVALSVLRRNAACKLCPERWDTHVVCPDPAEATLMAQQVAPRRFDVVFVYDDEIYHNCCRDLSVRQGRLQSVCHVIGIDTEDRTDHADVVAQQTVQIYQAVCSFVSFLYL